MLIAAAGELLDFVTSHEKTLKELSIVSELKIVDADQFGDVEAVAGSEFEGLLVGVQPAPGEKCERCWIRSETVGQMEGHPTICSRCFEVVEALNPHP